MNSMSKELSRQQRRQAERKSVKREKVTYTLTQAQVDDIKLEATRAALEQAFLLMLALPVLSCRDMYGFGKKRLTALGDDISKKYTAFNDGYITLEDCQVALDEETGITVSDMIDISRRLA